MTTNFSEAPQSARPATIYTFPPRGRFAALSHVPPIAADSQSLPGVKVASGSGWYHDEAIQEAMKAEQRRKS